MVSLKGKFTQKESWSEMKKLTKTRPRLVLEIFHFNVPHGRRHDSHFLNGNEAKMTSQLQC